MGVRAARSRAVNVVGLSTGFGSEELDGHSAFLTRNAVES